jgi:hypothetical protein
MSGCFCPAACPFSFRESDHHALNRPERTKRPDLAERQTKAERVDATVEP